MKKGKKNDGFGSRELVQSRAEEREREGEAEMRRKTKDCSIYAG